MTLHPLDVAVVLAYLVVTLAIGLYFSRRNHTTERYFLGGRNFPGWAIGLSFIGSTISSVTFIAYPADSFKTAWLRLLPPLAFPLVVMLAAYAFIPFFRRGTAQSAYHYLYLRFGKGVSIYAATVYLMAQLVRAATITYLLAILLASMTGLSVVICIALAAGTTALYTVKGGFEAVVWTDVIQTVVLLAGAVACIGFVIHALPGGVTQIFQEAWESPTLSSTSCLLPTTSPVNWTKIRCNAGARPDRPARLGNRCLCWASALCPSGRASCFWGRASGCSTNTSHRTFPPPCSAEQKKRRIFCRISS